MGRRANWKALVRPYPDEQRIWVCGFCFKEGAVGESAYYAGPHSKGDCVSGAAQPAGVCWAQQYHDIANITIVM